MSKKVYAASLAAIVVATGIAAGCGDGDDEDEPARPASAATSDTATSDAATSGTATSDTTTSVGATSEAATTGAGATAAAYWGAPNGDWGNTRVAISSIDSSNVEQLGEAWRVPITATGTFGGYASTPIILDGVVFTQDLSSNVQAIDLASGEILWEKKYDSNTVGPNGVAVADGRVYGATNEFSFALDAATGEELWQSEKMVRNEREGIDMAPGVNGDLVYVSTVPGNPEGFYKGDGQGILWAFNAETGETAWKYKTVPDDLWAAEHKDINSGGGLWHAPAFDDQGSMYISVANPGPWPGTKTFPWGQSRPGPNPDTNTLVKLNAATGEVEWKNQVIPHDIYDWDLQLSPVLADADDGTQLVVTAGKMGVVYAMDRASGETVWQTQVGRHSGNEQDNQLALDGKYDQIPKLPRTVYPGILGGVETQMAIVEGVVFAPIVNMGTTFTSQTEYELDLANGKGEMDALDLTTGEVLWKHDFDTPPYGAATVANDLVFTTTFDGTLHALDRATGDEVWTTKLPAGTNATVAIAGDTLVTAASFPQSAEEKPSIIAYRIGATPSDGGTTTGSDTKTTTGEDTGTTASEDPGTDGATIFSASCGSCHTLAAAGTTGSIGPNLDQSQLDVESIAAKVTNGGGGMPAFGGRMSEDAIQAVAQYVADNRDPNAEGGTEPGASP